MVWAEAQELVDLGEEYTSSLRRRMDEASEVGRLTLSRALLDLQEVPDARDGLLLILEQDRVEPTVHMAAIELLGEGLPPASVAKELARRLDLPRNISYRIVQDTSRAHEA